MNTIIIFCAQYLYLVGVVVVFVYFLRQPKARKKHMAVFGIISLVSAYIVAKIAGHFYYDPRPFVAGNVTPLIPHSPDNGFPSDHALLMSAFTAISVVYDKKLSLFVGGITLLVGVARVYAGVHHIVDILGSMGIAGIVTGLVYWFFESRIVFY